MPTWPRCAAWASPCLPVFIISPEACTAFTEHGREHAFKLIEAEVLQSVAFVEQEMGKTFGNSADPLLLSVRSGARASMPGMMNTILNLGLNDEAVVGLAAKAGNERFAWDSYRRFVQMYGDVVMGLKPASKEDHDPFEVIIDMLKEKKGVQLDTELDAEDLKELVVRFKGLIRARIGRDFPTDPWEQLWGAVVAVFESWNNERACVYRELNDIPQSWGTAVNVQAMVFATWATAAPPAWRSRAMPAPVRTCSTASSWSTPRARTWWPASARRSRCRWWGRSVGRAWHW